eukprot:gnl/MRDRNA2_/MRDRNA2_59080_c0_seq1.p1 gnl/MRDRNA2_/MRDRNA2_59080_c0~~gnl/MRDRNA2_/MRDRNA2_59080_c0_seq1.p1  ORF type:complete len:326 (-),score=52.06 gnl/MRDRNA2_/MRDRNA2_59080_c0_seq1:52-1029(-)
MLCKPAHHVAFLLLGCLHLATAQGGRGGGVRGGYRGGGGAAAVGAGIGAGAAGKGENSMIALVIIAVGMCILVGLTFYIKNSERDNEEERRPILRDGETYGQGWRPPPPAAEYIRESSALATVPIKRLPSGTWRGYYNQYGSRHAVCEFKLAFDGDRMHGNGVDDVGSYSIDGLYGQGSGRISFRKQYVRGSPAANGRISQENLGHYVEYRGECAGTDLGHGVRGLWYVETALYRGSGRFHIWPVLDLQSPEAAAAGAAFKRTHPTFKVSSDNVCAVCYDRAIDVLLDPCGHIVICADCAERLNPRKCPICRTDILQVLPAQEGS